MTWAFLQGPLMALVRFLVRFLVGTLFLFGAYFLGHHEGTVSERTAWQIADAENRARQAGAKRVITQMATQHAEEIEALSISLAHTKLSAVEAARAAQGAGHSAGLPASVVRKLDLVR